MSMQYPSPEVILLLLAAALKQLPEDAEGYQTVRITDAEDVKSGKTLHIQSETTDDTRILIAQLVPNEKAKVYEQEAIARAREEGETVTRMPGATVIGDPAENPVDDMVAALGLPGAMSRSQLHTLIHVLHMALGFDNEHEDQDDDQPAPQKARLN